ncbi:LuxR C-terminal-related transcriptional regulator [Patulibacter defluvii]|uniref:LuxR C-terminal-related transcriptional regulator n=1 Tax=Patulibacter defluvii TaxID=3095358 RepID=UPI002A75F6AF|nr:LuxR C-terminal-related transcriptional regulator [Patulibacter sp. DM4]
MDALEAAAAAPLVVVRAPAGCGKTTAVAQWLARSGRLAVRLSLGGAHDDPRRYFADLLAGCAPVLGARLDPARRMLAAGAPLEAAVVPLLATALDDGPPLTLVLDGYQALHAPAAHRVTEVLLDALPVGLTVVIATRTPPPLRLARRKAAGIVAEVGADELRFRSDESQALLDRRVGLGLPPSAVAAIADRVGGWAAGLAAAADALAEPDAPSAPERRAARAATAVARAVRAQVVERLRPELRAFAAAVSILPRLTAPLATAVTGTAAASELLAELRAATPLLLDGDRPGDGDGGGWWRCADVLADALRAELLRTRPADLPALHRRASAWFAEAGLFAEALDHAGAAGDHDRAAALLRERWVAIAATRGVGALRAQVDRCAAALGDDDPWVAAVRLAMATLWDGVDQRAVGGRIAALHRCHGDDPDVALACALVLAQPFDGDVERALRVGAAAGERFADRPFAIEQLAGPLAFARWLAGDGDGARELLEPRVLRPQSSVAAAWAAAVLALVDLDDGHVARGRRHARRAQAALATAGVGRERVRPVAQVALGRALAAAGRHGEARRQVDAALAAEERRPGTPGQLLALTADAELALAEGDHARAAARLERAAVALAGVRGASAIGDRIAALRGTAGDADPDPLRGTEPSAAEQRVLELLETDLSLVEIGSRLFLSRNTVKSHVRRIYRRLGASTREEAVALARGRQLV